jgi:hypothetical protein
LVTEPLSKPEKSPVNHPPTFPCFETLDGDDAFAFFGDKGFPFEVVLSSELSTALSAA